MDFGIKQLPKNGLTMVDLFCGAGIGGLGFKKAGYDIIYAVDNMQYAVDTYNKNVGNHAVCLDIKKIDLNDLPEADVYSGGFPCQAFSLGGKGEGENDKKIGDLGYYFLEAIRLKKPKAFFIENVKGIVSKKHRGFFDKLISEFENIGYNVEFKVSDCYEYGIPQIRERVFIVGIRNDLDKSFVFPESLPQENRIHLKEAISDLPDPDLEHNVKNHKEYYNDGFSPRFLSRNRQRQWDEPSFTIVSTARQLPLYPEPANYDVRVRDVKNDPPPRRFTVRECLRIQTVPDEFEFSDSIPSNKQHIRCSGIPTLIAYNFSILLSKYLI